MSCDASYILLRSGCERCFHNRVGGDSLPGMLLEGHLESHPPLLELTAGPGVLELLAEERPFRTLEELALAESSLRACAFADRAERNLWWWALPSSLCSPLYRLASAWPDWHVMPLPGGPRAQLALTDRGDARLLSTLCRDAVRQDLARVTEHHRDKSIRVHFGALMRGPEWQP